MGAAFSFDDAVSKIYSDSQGAYTDGVGGVTATLFRCGSGDAVLNLDLLATNRRINWVIGDPLPWAPPDPKPTWVPSTITTRGILNIRNIVVGYNADGTWSTDYTLNRARCSRSAPCTFTTTMGSSFVMPDRKTYHLNMVNSQITTTYGPDGGTYPELMNANYMTSPVQVTYTPGGDPTSDTWTVEPVNQGSYYVSALWTATGKTVARLGNYDTYFRLTISRK